MSSSTLLRWIGIAACVAPLGLGGCSSEPLAPEGETAPAVGTTSQALGAVSWSEPVPAELSGPISAVGDLNGDGYGDFAVASLADGGPVGWVIFGSATGPAASPRLTLAGGPRAFVMAGTDLDADGFSDLIIGDPTAQADDGVVTILFGGSDGVTLDRSVTVPTPWPMGHAWFGVSVAVGRFDDDQYGDFAIGASELNGSSGAVAFYRGGPGRGVPQIVDTLEGEGQFGASLASVGDMNGDGRDDVVIGALAANMGAGGLGVASWNGAGWDLVDVDTPGAAIAVGWPVHAAGDVDGDGLADCIVGALDGTTGQPAPLLFRGSAMPSVMSLSPVPRATGVGGSSAWGTSFAGGGDVDGDGFADVVLGTVTANSGRIDLLRGSPAGLLAPTAAVRSSPANSGEMSGRAVGLADANGDGFSDVISLDTTVAGPMLTFQAGGGELPSTTASATVTISTTFGAAGQIVGDFNGDGFDDVIVASSGSGASSQGQARFHLGTAQGLQTESSWSRQGSSTGAAYGGDVAGLGDVNGDGFADFAISASQFLTGGQGYVEVFYGRPEDAPTNNPGWTWTNTDNGNGMGQSIDRAGDVNGDGYADLIQGVPGAGASGQGAARLFLGGPTGLPASPSWSVTGTRSGVALGSVVSGAGDVNGDGLDDVLIGVPGWSEGARDGLIMLFYGDASGDLGTTADWQFLGPSGIDDVGTRVRGVGDVDGDGFADFVVGHDTGWYLFRGGAAGPAVNPDHTYTGNTSGFGTTMAGGDVDGDGRSDLLLGDSDRSGGGRVTLRRGSDVTSASVWNVSGTSASQRVGASVDASGDINGDGFADILVGNSATGAVSVYLGSTALVSARPVPLDPSARRPGMSARIVPGGLASSRAFDVEVTAWSPLGATSARLELEVEAAGSPFDGQGTILSPQTASTSDTTTLRVSATGLGAGRAYHWRARLRYAAAHGRGMIASRWTHGGELNPTGGHVRAQPSSIRPVTDTLSTVIDTPLDLTAASLLANDVYGGTGTLTVSSVRHISGGGSVASVDATTWRFSPGSVATNAVLEYDVSDGLGESAVGTILVSVGAPSFTLNGPWTVTEGGGRTLTATRTDTLGGAATFGWDLDGDGQWDDAVGEVVDYTGIDGPRTLDVSARMTVGMAAVVVTSMITENNAPPTATLTPVTGALEGTPIAVTVDASDPAGAADPLTFQWNFGDGQTQADGPASVMHSWPNEGSYQVMVTVSDGDGGMVAQQRVVSVQNVAPRFVTLAGVCYDLPFDGMLPFGVEDPGADTMRWTAVHSRQSLEVRTTDCGSGPARALCGTVVLPAALQTAGDHTITLIVTDGRDSAELDWDFRLGDCDPDADGIPNVCEEQCPGVLDPAGVDDPNGDPDGDGLTTLAECSAGTSPCENRPPTAPSPNSPLDAASWRGEPGSLVLSANNATDPEGHALTYAFELFEVDRMTSLFSVDGVMETASQTTSPPVSADLTIGATYCWRARAWDGVQFGAYSSFACFEVVDPGQMSDLPAPRLLLPEHAAFGVPPSPLFVVAPIEGFDVLGYELALARDASITDVVAVGTVTTLDPSGFVLWRPEVVLEDGEYHWSARGYDSEGVGQAGVSRFTVGADVTLPEPPVIVAPADGEVVGQPTTRLRWRGADEEGLFYTLALLQEPAQNQLIAETGIDRDPSGENGWPVELQDGQTYTWRVHATDAAGNDSAPASATFTVKLRRSPPGAPTWLTPEPRAVFATVQTIHFTFAGATDPDGDPLTYQLEVLSAEDGESVTVIDDLTADAAAEGEAAVGGWSAEAAFEGGGYVARVRAFDGVWYGPWSASLPFAVRRDIEPPDDTTPGAGATPEDCGCSLAASPRVAPLGWLGLALVGLMLARGRRR